MYVSKSKIVGKKISYFGVFLEYFMAKLELQSLYTAIHYWMCKVSHKLPQVDLIETSAIFTADENQEIKNKRQLLCKG